MEKRKILVFGTFDLLHPGHRYFLNQAKKQGDYLVVVVARDKNVLKQKGYLPKQDEKTRLKNIKELDYVNEAYLGEKDLRKREKIIKKVNPDIICLGYDQKANFKSQCFKVKRLEGHKPEKYKSSILRGLQK